ncbi:hypothetical protein REPUB_Repub19eG0137600 [Reevesia pubescens]
MNDKVAAAESFGSRWELLYQMSMKCYTFGLYKIDPKEVFYSTPLSYAMVNLRPVVHGAKLSTLLIPLLMRPLIYGEQHRRLVECYHKASSLTFTIQDKPKAGQTVPHVHIHILPMTDDDLERNDEIYDAIDVKENVQKEKLDLDKEMKERSLEEICKEANE